MSDIVERSDVDISKIFGWGRVFEIEDPTTGEILSTIYMKLLGDADLNRARVFALRKSAELRRKLKDQNSDEHVAWIKDINELETDDIINLIVLFSGRELSKRAVEKVRIPTPKPPKSKAGLEKMERFQKEVDEYPAKKQKAIADQIEIEINTLRTSLNGKSKEELYRQYVNILTDEFCEREAIIAFEDYQTFLGCYTDNTYKIRWFRDDKDEPDFEKFDNLEPTVKAQFKDAYRSLDIDISELKKLRRATP